ncbi:MAG TPA: glycoside hydrolase family 28 protein, partial [Sunxiuqinia sp.]|nr:glycoside hydrolase family 28 protein [Sunxiuqinia sp.]
MKIKEMTDKKFWNIVFATLLLIPVMASAQMKNTKWTDDVGAQTYPETDYIVKVNDFGTPGNNLITSTKAIQAAIDDCAKHGGGEVTFEPGVYLTGAIYLKDNVNLHIDKDVEIRGAIDLSEYPEIETRVAGVEMRWPSAIINVLDKKNVAISGTGTIHAQGRYNWERYWELRENYTPRGLRWAADYDCKRVRTVLVQNSNNVTVKDITLKQSGFWTVHLLYSSHVTVDGIVIRNNIDGHGPSTDGVDIDSSSKILVENCDIDCNDDNFCLKAGRDADGLRVNRPTEYVVIRDCISRRGGGLVTFGSETSGGIRHVIVQNLQAHKTMTAIRFKSALSRGGVLSDISISHIHMNEVGIPIVVTLNWNPSYSYASIDEHSDTIPDYWKVLLEKVPASKGIPTFKDVTINDIKAKDCHTAI